MLSNNITQDNKIGLILAANVVIIDLAKKANIILITPNKSYRPVYILLALYTQFSITRPERRLS